MTGKSFFVFVFLGSGSDTSEEVIRVGVGP